ncbi:MAG: hypothetical protein ACRYFU_12445 [Janthinobacterium lividum]
MNNLHTYLHDHLAGADLAVELLESLLNNRQDEVTGVLAAGILTEVKQDRDTLRCLAESIESGSNVAKGMAAWVSEKAMRVKLNPKSGESFDTFQALEFLALGVLGKLHLWRTLEIAAQEPTARAGLDLRQLIARAEDQHARLEQRRLQLAAVALP